MSAISAGVSFRALPGGMTVLSSVDLTRASKALLAGSLPTIAASSESPPETDRAPDGELPNPLAAGQIGGAGGLIVQELTEEHLRLTRCQEFY